MKLNTIQRKKFRVTGKLKKVSSPDRLRLSISRSANNISAQIIDDTKKKLDNFYTNLKKEREKEKKRLEKKRKLDQKRDVQGEKKLAQKDWF